MASRRLLWVVLGLAVVLVLGTVAYRRFLYHDFVGTVIQSPEPAFDFELMSAEGPVRLSDFRGKVVILFFGYTHCPDVCPTTLAKLAKVMEYLDNDAQQVQVLMISVDPDRDSPEVVQSYASHFYPSFIGLTGTPEQIQEVATKYGIYYKKREGTSESGYLVDHTASLILIDPEGYVKLIFPSVVPEDEEYLKAMAEDIRYILRH